MSWLERRLSRLERETTPAWQAWVGIPAEQWPDEVLDACIRAGLGLPAEVELTDELLEKLIRDAEKCENRR